MYNHACAFLAHLSKLESWNDAIHAPVRACVPAQPDTWSCGHRTILFIDIALRRSMLDAISAGDVDRLIVSRRATTPRMPNGMPVPQKTPQQLPAEWLTHPSPKAVMMA